MVRRLRASLRELEFSVSYTTRSPRPREKNGRDYHFVSAARFRQMADRHEFLEWARVYGNAYGTSLQQIQRAQRQRRDILLDIDVEGHHKVRQQLPQAVSIFLLPPSFEELRRRLTRRHADAPEVIEKRLAAAREEIAHWQEYDYAVVNEDVSQATRALRAIVKAARWRRDSQKENILEISNTFGG